MPTKVNGSTPLNQALFTARTCEWATPANLFEYLKSEFDFDLDVAASSGNAKCPRFYTKQQDALTMDWYKDSDTKTIFCNPPFGKGIEKWLLKVQSESSKGATIVVVIPFRSDTEWFHRHVINKASEIRLIKGRLKYNDGNQCSPFPSAILVYRPDNHNTCFFAVDKLGKKI